MIHHMNLMMKLMNNYKILYNELEDIRKQFRKGLILRGNCKWIENRENQQSIS